MQEFALRLAFETLLALVLVLGLAVQPVPSFAAPPAQDAGPNLLQDDGFEWVAVKSHHRLRPGMFVAQVVGKSMEPAIPDGAYCLFRSPVEGTRQGKTVVMVTHDRGIVQRASRSLQIRDGEVSA